MTVQDAINQLKTIRREFAVDMKINNVEALDKAIMALTCLKKPNQSEPLTDREQRIFLAAMDREEKICKEVSKECWDCREPHEDSLVRTCHEITRKVKGALWT